MYCVVVSVGYVCEDGMVIIVNLLWLLLVCQVEVDVGLQWVYIVNDFEVVVYVVVQVDVSGVLYLCGLEIVVCGLILVVGFGIGLGVVLWIFIVYGLVVLFIEVGQLILVVSIELEMVIVCYMQCDCVYVLIEYVIFGFGLMNLYCVVCVL